MFIFLLFFILIVLIYLFFLLPSFHLVFLLRLLVFLYIFCASYFCAMLFFIFLIIKLFSLTLCNFFPFFPRLLHFLSLSTSHPPILPSASPSSHLPCLPPLPSSFSLKLSISFSPSHSFSPFGFHSSYSSWSSSNLPSLLFTSCFFLLLSLHVHINAHLQVLLQFLF